MLLCLCAANQYVVTAKRRDKQMIKKALRIGSEIIVVLTIVFFAVYLSEKYHEKTGEFFSAVSVYLISILLIAYLIIEIVRNTCDLIEKCYEKAAYKLWIKTKYNSRENIINYLDNENDIPLSIQGQLFACYTNDEEIMDRLLKKVKVSFSQEYNKSMISFFVLDNCYHSSVMKVFHEEKDFKNECEQISKEISNSIMNDFYKEAEITKNNFSGTVLNMLHASLPQNHIDKDRIQYIMRYVLVWIYNNITVDNIQDYSYEVSLVLSLLPKIKHKLYLANIDNENINETIKKIEKSAWVKAAINIAYKNIFCKKGEKICSPYIYATYSSVLTTYYSKLGFIKKARMLKKIKEKNEQYSFKDFISGNESALFLLFSAASFQSIDYNWRLSSDIASIVFACIDCSNGLGAIK